MGKKRIFLILCAVAIFGGVLGFLLLHQNRPPEPAEVKAALSALAGETYYTFREQCNLETAGETRNYFTLTGERAGENVHLSGTVLGTQTEVYLVDSVLYQQVEGADWLVNRFPDVSRSVSLFTELDPASAFTADGSPAAPVKQGKYWQVEMIPSDPGWFGDYFQDVRYRLLLDKNATLCSATLTGVLKEDGQSRITLELSILEQKENYTVAPPVTE